MQINQTEAQEMHECIGAALQAIKNGDTAVAAELERALEIASIVVSDSEASSSDTASALAAHLTDILLTRDEEAEGLSTTEDLLDAISGLEDYLDGDYTNEDAPPNLSL